MVLSLTLLYCLSEVNLALARVRGAPLGSPSASSAILFLEAQASRLHSGHTRKAR